MLLYIQKTFFDVIVKKEKEKKKEKYTTHNHQLHKFIQELIQDEIQLIQKNHINIHFKILSLQNTFIK